MNTNFDEDMQERVRLWKRMNMVDARARADRRFKIILVLGGLALLAVSFWFFNWQLPY